MTQMETAMKIVSSPIYIRTGSTRTVQKPRNAFANSNNFLDFIHDWFILPSVTNDNERPGGRLNKKDGLTRYDNSHVKDKTS